MYVVKQTFSIFRQILKRSYVFVPGHDLKPGVELETENRSVHESFTETLFAVPKEDTTHSHENIIDTKENLKQMHSPVDETLDEEFYLAEDVLSVENVQLEKLKQQDSDDKEIEANINQNDETEIFEDKYVQKNVLSMVQENLGATDLFVETSVQKTSDACVEITHETSKEEEDDNEAYYLASENEDIPFIENIDSDNV